MGDTDDSPSCDADQQQYEFWVQNRKYARAKITRQCNYIRQNIDPMTEDEKFTQRVQLNGLKDQVLKLDSDVEKVIWKYVDDRTALNREMDNVEHYSNEIAFVMKLLEPRRNITSAPSQLKLPVLQLPEFSNRNGESLELYFY